MIVRWLNYNYRDIIRHNQIMVYMLSEREWYVFVLSLICNYSLCDFLVKEGGRTNVSSSGKWENNGLINRAEKFHYTFDFKRKEGNVLSYMPLYFTSSPFILITIVPLKLLQSFWDWFSFHETWFLLEYNKPERYFIVFHILH